MIRHLCIRLLWLVVTLLGVTALTFLIMNIIPGGPFSELEGGRPLPEETKRLIEQQYGLDRPLWQQYIIYITNFLKGDFGRSLVDWTEVGPLLSKGFSASAALGLSSLALSLIVGIPLGIAAAIKSSSVLDHFATTVSITAVALPNFVLGLLLIIIFAVNLNLLPVSGWTTWQHRILPIVALSMEPIALFTRYTRSSVLEVLNEQYITVARSKGLSERIVIYRHVFKNAAIPIVTVIGTVIPRLLIGSFLIEIVFSIPGTGRTFVGSILRRDYPVIMAVAFLYASLVALANLFVDFMYLYLDPRIRYD